jgi:2-iminoacetate synthase
VSFVAEFNSLPLDALIKRSQTTSLETARATLLKPQLSLSDFAALISPAAGELLEPISRRAHTITKQRFGKVIRLFAPLYLSNECINNCKYCGFSRDNPILRLTLSIEQVQAEARELARQGFRNILLVAGEHPKFVSNHYLADCIEAIREEFPSISLEVGPMETADYLPLSRAGAEGLVVYQESYCREVYSAVHTAGPKRDFYWRLDTPERACAAGFRRLGIGALYGLADWRLEAISLAFHADHLLRNCWKAQLTISLPRLRPHAGEFPPLTQMSDRELVQLLCAFRLVFPDAGLVLSTRESPSLRDGLFPLGITHISAGSHTEPGGYTGAGKENLHHTQRGRIVALAADSSEWATPPHRLTGATSQFEIADDRSPLEIARLLESMGYEPVWKDWDQSICA